MVEGAEASDEEETKLRNTRFGDRLRSRPGATMAHDGARNDVAPYGMNLESGAGSSGKQTRERTKENRGARANGGGGGSHVTSSTRGDGSSSAASRGSSGGFLRLPARTPRGEPRGDRREGRRGPTASTGTGRVPRCPRSSTTRARECPRRKRCRGAGDGAGTIVPAVARRPPRTPGGLNASSTGAGSSRGTGVAFGALSRSDAREVSARDRSPRWRGWVRTVEELAALSDADVADISRGQPLKVSSLRKIARRAMEGDGEGK